MLNVNKQTRGSAEALSLKHRALRALGHLHWIRAGIRERFIKALVPFRNGQKKFSVAFSNYTYSGALNNLIDWRVYFLGGHELKELKFIAEVAGGGGVMLDVGMNVGHHALYLSSYFKQVIGFEPYAPLAKIARERMDVNKVRNVEIYEVGLGEKAKKLTYCPPSDDNWGVGAFDVSGTNEATGLNLQIQNGDEFLSGKLTHTISFVKIDVEGMERDVIKGLCRTIQIHKPIVFFEYGEKTSSSYRDLNDFFSDFPEDYRFYLLVCNVPKWGVFNSNKCVLKPFIDLKQTGNILGLPLKYRDHIFRLPCTL